VPLGSRLPIWAVLYLLLLLGITIWSFVEDRRQGKRTALLILDVTAMLVLGGLFAAYFHPPLGATLGRSAAPLFAAAVAYLAIGAHRDIARLQSDPELSPRQNLVAEHLGILLGVLFISPAIAFAALAVKEAW
jgi:hypothetical protein